MNILVCNLSTSVVNTDLLKLFSAYGTVSHAAIVRDPKSGRSKGSAFLEMPREDEGQQAVLALNHTVLDGQAIAVQEILYKAGEFNN